MTRRGWKEEELTFDGAYSRKETGVSNEPRKESEWIESRSRERT